MSLDFICAITIECGKNIEIPRDKFFKKANYYRFKSGNIKFYISDDGANIPEDATALIFPNFDKRMCHINYGEPLFTYQPF